jgi:hypothetical protein
VSCVPDVSSVSIFSVVQTVESSGTQYIEGRQNIGQSGDTGNIRNTRHRSKINKKQQKI